MTMYYVKILFQKPAILLVLLSSLAFVQNSAFADEHQALFDMSIEDLMNVEITSVSKKKEKLSDAAAAIYVIT